MKLIQNKYNKEEGISSFVWNLPGPRRNTVGLNVYLLPILCLFFSMPLLTSCSDDFSSGNEFDPDKPGITLLVPDVTSFSESDTRDDGIASPTTEEGRISRLDIVAVNTYNNELTFFNDVASTGTQNGYSIYKINIEQGNYKFYVLGNLNYYLTGNANDVKNLSDVDINSEDKLKELILYFNSTEPLTVGKLPMACLHENLKINGALLNNGINLQSNTTIVADMDFLCSKVRYTILFNRGEDGFSEYGKNTIDFNTSTANFSNIRKATGIRTEADLYSGVPTDFIYGSWHGNLRRCFYPTNNGAYNNNYPSSSTDADLITFNLGNDSWDLDYSERHAWQGTVYLPENNTNNVSRTQINLPYSLNGEPQSTPKSITLFDGTVTNAKGEKMTGLVRSKMYDVRAKVINPDFITADVTVSDWELKTLYYDLHGSVELTVEKTEQEIIASGHWETMGFDTNIPSTEIEFEFPKIKYEDEYLDFFVAEVIQNNTVDDEGDKYVFEDEWPYHFRIKVNPRIPFAVLYALNNGNKQYDDGETVHTINSLSYFHIIAGNIYKKIDVKVLEIDPYLTVTPQLIVIDTREYYLSGDLDDIKIRFSTNYDNNRTGVDFYIDDPSGLIQGVGEGDLKLSLGNGIDSEGNISVTSGVVELQVANILEGHSFWNIDREYTITFVLRVYKPGTNQIDRTLSVPVRIVIKPFTTNYVIHFHDAYGGWYAPHVFIYQDLLLPSDLTRGKRNDDVEIDASSYSGKIVGYVEQNGGQQWNAATQYVFSNNVTFKGWYGYGGPKDNNPYDIYENYINNPGFDRMGFVMMGTPQNGSEFSTSWTWNESYGYTNRNPDRHVRYRFDMNFNEDHETRLTENNKWGACSSCYGNYISGSKYSGANDDYDYPGIMMEDEGNGWWRYTLTGVAQPGKTMIIFADTHAPWNNHQPWNTETENKFRYPGAYDTGLPLFDFEDNEGWFIYNGPNSEDYQPTNHFFYDDKPDI